MDLVYCRMVDDSSALYQFVTAEDNKKYFRLDIERRFPREDGSVMSRYELRIDSTFVLTYMNRGTPEDQARREDYTITKKTSAEVSPFVRHWPPVLAHPDEKIMTRMRPISNTDRSMRYEG